MGGWVGVKGIAEMLEQLDFFNRFHTHIYICVYIYLYNEFYFLSRTGFEAEAAAGKKI